MADCLKQRNCPIITITSIGENSLRQYADCSLFMSTREKLNSKIAPFSTEYSLSLILNILYSGVFSRNYDSNYEIKVKRTKEIEKNRFSSSDILQEDPSSSSVDKYE